MRRTKVGALACIIASALLVAACGSENDGTDGSKSAAATTAATTANAALKGDPIKVGMICSCTGAQAAALGNTDEVAKAWASTVNAGGGINGHPVELIVKDDGNDAAKSLAAVKELVEQDHVVAIVGQVSNQDGSWVKYLEAKGVPVVGGVSEEVPFLTSANFFPSGTQLPVSIVAMAQMAKESGKKSFGLMYCAEIPVCAQAGKLGQAAAALNGLSYKTGKVSATAPDYTAPCLQMRDAGVDVLYIANNQEVSRRILASCAKQGYRPMIVAEATTSGPEWKKDPNTQGATVVVPDAPYEDASIPAVKEFQQAVDKYAPGVRTAAQFNYAAIFPWVGGKLFEAAAEAADLTPTSTPADVKRGLYALKDETLGGLAPPLNFTEGQPTLVPCYFAMQVEDETFKTLDDGQPQCLDQQQLEALAKGLNG